MAGPETPQREAPRAEGKSMRARFDVQIAFTVTYIGYCAIYLVRKPFSVVKSQLGLSTAALGIIDTAWLVAYAAGQLLLGQARARFAPADLLFLGFVGAGLCQAGCSIAASSAQWALLQGLNGFFQSCANPLLVLHVASLYPAATRASAVGAWQTSQQAGSVLANLACAALLPRVSIPTIFALCGAACALNAVPVRWVAARGDAREGNAAKKSPSSLTTRALLRVPGVAAVCGAYFLIKLVRYALLFWLPFFLVKAAGLEPSQAAVLSTLFDLGGAAGGVAAGFLADRMGGAVFAACLPFCVAAAAALLAHARVYAQGVYANAYCMLSVGFFVAGPDGILGGAAARYLAENANYDTVHAPAISGLVNGCGSVGAIVQGVGTAALVARVGWRGLFVSLAALMTLAPFIMADALRAERKHLARGECT